MKKYRRTSVIESLELRQLMHAEFPGAELTTQHGALAGYLFSDTNANGVQDGTEGTVADRVVFLDQNNNFAPDANEQSVVTGSQGQFAFDDLEPGTYHVRRVFPDGFTYSTPLLDVTVGAGDALTGLAIGAKTGTFTPPPASEPTSPGTPSSDTGSLAGVVFSDANGDGTKNTGDSYLGDRTVFLDTNGNYQPDAGERQTNTDANGNFRFDNLPAGTYHVRRVLPRGYTYSTPLINLTLGDGQSIGSLVIGAKTGTFTPPPDTTPTDPSPQEPTGDTGTIAGYVFSDTNGDGVWNNSETKLSDRVVFLDTNNNFQLDAGERQTTTDANGNYRFTGLAAGTYHVRRVLPKGYTYSTALIDVTLGTGQSLSNQVIGAKLGTFTPPTDPTPNDPPPASETGTLSGYLFNDANKNGVQDSSEGRTTDRTVFLDSNNNGKLDAGERQTTTDNQGRFSFTDLAAGVYHVRRVFPSGFTYSTALIDLNLSAGQNVSGLTIGSMDTTTPPPTDNPPPDTGDTAAVSGWSGKATIPVLKSELFGAAIGGKLYTFGGFIDTTYKPTTTAHVYDPATNHWSSIASLPVALTHAAHAHDDRYLYFAGGYPGTGPNGTQKFATTDVRYYDTATNAYGTLPALPSARGGGAMALLGRTLYFMGGNDINRVDQTTVWSLNLDNLGAGWVTRTSLPAARNHPAAVALNGSVYFIAGQTAQDADATMRSDMWRYDPGANAWTSVAPLIPGRSHITGSTFVYHGQIVTIAGESSHNGPIRDIDLYNPATNTWTSIGQLPAGRFSGVGGLLNDTTVIYAAGYTGGTFAGNTWTAAIG